MSLFTKKPPADETPKPVRVYLETNRYTVRLIDGTERTWEQTHADTEYEPPLYMLLPGNESFQVTHGDGPIAYSENGTRYVVPRSSVVWVAREKLNARICSWDDYIDEQVEDVTGDGHGKVKE